MLIDVAAARAQTKQVPLLNIPAMYVHGFGTWEVSRGVVSQMLEPQVCNESNVCNESQFKVQMLRCRTAAWFFQRGRSGLEIDSSRTGVASEAYYLCYLTYVKN